MSAPAPQRFWKLPFSRGELDHLLAAMASEAGLPEARVELLIMADRDMEALHRASLHRPGPTNILSFPLASRALPGHAPHRGMGGGGPLGSLVLSADTLARESRLYGQAPAAYCLRLLAHGFAHLLGFEHGAAMEALCRRLEQAALSVLESAAFINHQHRVQS